MVIRVLLVDDHTAFRQPLAFMLAREKDIEVVAQAASIEEARAIVGTADVAVVDFQLPDGEGTTLIRFLRDHNPEMAVLLLTGSATDLQLAQAVEAGAAGVMQKWVGVDEIIRGVRKLASGEPLMTGREIAAMLHIAGRAREENREADKSLARLTPREHDVLQALADGLADKEIAARLDVQPQTVRVHMTSILDKLGVDSRLQAVLFAIRHGAVTVD